MQKYWAIFKLNLIIAMQYKIYGLIYTFFDLFPPLISIAYWHQAFANQTNIAGYTQNSLLIYLITSGICRTILITYPEQNLAKYINQGMFKIFLLKPISPIKHELLGEFAFKFNRSLFTIPSLFLLFYLCFKLTHQVPQFSITPPVILIFIISFLLNFFIKYLIGLSAVWTTEIQWLLSINDLIELILSGSLLPLDFFPIWFRNLSNYLPFQYLNYIPTKAITHQLPIETIPQYILISLTWLLILYLLYRLVWHHAKKHYSSYGG